MLKRMIIMTDFSKILDKAKELENKMKESQEKIKTIKAEGVSGSNSIKVTLNVNIKYLIKSRITIDLDIH
mgnify:CR=1 FL=1